VTREVVRAHLASRLADDGFGRGFLTGGITFAALKPMRTIPFEMICVAGLDDGAFPRRDPPRSFDLMAAEPRPGDRSLADDDRYLFLETLLAARQRLVLTFIGRSPRDGSEQAPSVVVAELLDHLDRAFVAADGRPARQHLLVEHRLQPWSPAYFDAGEPRLRSYSRESFEASRALAAGPGPEAPFIGGRREADRGGQRGVSALDVTLRDLMELWVNPSRGYCRQVLQLRLEAVELELEEAEPFTVDSLAGYRLRQWLLERRLLRDGENADRGEELALMRAAGELPLAGLGSASYARLDREVRDFVRDLPDHRLRQPAAIELAGGGWRLSGQLDGLTDRGLLRFRLAAVKPKDLIRAWVAHVVWNVWERQRGAAGGTSGRPDTLETRVYGRGRGVTEGFRFPPLAEPRNLLESLVDGYRKGLERPLPLFAEASFRFADQRRHLADPKSRRRKSPLAAARDGWRGGDYRAGDRDDPYVALCFRGREPLEVESFATWAEYLWGPIFDHLEEL
jgi:exodeoxyribonuclease V gamma subunit